jgi:hypothetical protein
MLVPYLMPSDLECFDWKEPYTRRVTDWVG